MSIVDVYKNLFGRKGIADGTVIDMAEHGRAGGVSTGTPFKGVQEIPNKVVYDIASSTVTYVGESRQGAATSAAQWRIFKLTQSGDTGVITFADGNDQFDNIWDNRASLSYS